MTESHIYLLDNKSRPLLTGQNNDRKMDSIGLNFLTKTTWKLETPGGIRVFQVLVHFCTLHPVTIRNMLPAFSGVVITGDRSRGKGFLSAHIVP